MHIQKTLIMPILTVRHCLFGIILTLLNLIVPFQAIALSAITSNVIHGSRPYITLDGGRTHINSSEPLLSIKLSDGRLITSQEDTSSSQKPIILSGNLESIRDIQTFVPIDGNNTYPQIDIQKLMDAPYHYWGDDDGDGDILANGKLSLEWYDANQNITAKVKKNPSYKLDACKAPYRLFITTGESLTLSTRYGIPNETIYKQSSHSYYFKPSAPSVCYAQPNLSNDSSNNTEYKDLDGPDWVKGKGFVPQDINNPQRNFPSTGTNNVYFYLLLANVTPEEIISANGARVFPESGSGVSLALSSARTPGWGKGSRDVALKIVLKGPVNSSANKNFSPSTFKLYSDRAKSKVLYSFKIERWYIAQGAHINASVQDAKDYCNRIGYRMPSVVDFTNANTGDIWTGGIPGRNINGYRRQLSYRGGNGKWIGGLLNEWGTLFNHSDHYLGLDDWETEHPQDWYWTIDTYKGNPLRVDLGDGDLYYNEPTYRLYRAACVKP
jgi:hypothetical protein